MEDGIGGVCSTRGGHEMCIENRSRKYSGKKPLGSPGRRCGSNIKKWVFGKQDVKV
jgi:hypothetical protein